MSVKSNLIRLITTTTYLHDSKTSSIVSDVESSATVSKPNWLYKLTAVWFFLTLALTLIFVFIPIILSKTLKLGLEKDTLIATIRSIIQLLAVGFVLQFIFDSESFLYIILMIMLMIGAATQNARKKGALIPGITWKLIVTFLFIELLTQGLLIGLQITPATAQYMIPFFPLATPRFTVCTGFLALFQLATPRFSVCSGLLSRKTS